MRAGPLVTIVLGCLATIVGLVGAWQTEVPRSANRNWAEATDRLRNQSGSATNTGIDAGYAAKNRRFAWGALAAFGVIAIALGFTALRQPPTGKKP